MPFDIKRINGPESSTPYQYSSKLNLKTYQEKLKEAFTENNVREDDREFLDARKIFLKPGVISQAKGSAYMELGGTKVIVSVFDPREIPKQNKYSLLGELYCDFKYSPFSGIKRRLPQTDGEERSLATSMKRALQSAVYCQEFPNFQVDIFANVLQDDGSALGAVITCAGLALADAGIPMYDVITATTVGVIDNRFILDPTAAEEDFCINGTGEANQLHGILMMARLSTLDQISELWQTGSLTLESIQTANRILVQSNKDIVQIVKQILVEKVQKHLRKEENSVD